MRQTAAAADDLPVQLAATSATVPVADGTTIQHLVSGPPRRLLPLTSTTLLRIAKEAVVNAATHAGPASIVVHLTYEPRQVRLEVGDDGRGADPDRLQAAMRDGHWGIAGMRERARAAGGTFVVRTTAGHGTRVVVALPAEPLT
jgi:signal transduction histidine kinase